MAQTSPAPAPAVPFDAVLYVGFMSLVDVPMYISRWAKDVEMSRPYLSLADGFHDLATRWIVTREWNIWQPEMPWMTLYFTVAVWISIIIMRRASEWTE